MAVRRLRELAERVVCPIVRLNAHSCDLLRFRASNRRITKGWNITLANRSETHRLDVNTSVVVRNSDWLRTNAMVAMLANEPRVLIYVDICDKVWDKR